MTHEANVAEYRELLGTILTSFAEEDGDDNFIYERDSAAKRTRCGDYGKKISGF